MRPQTATHDTSTTTSRARKPESELSAVRPARRRAARDASPSPPPTPTTSSARARLTQNTFTSREPPTNDLLICDDELSETKKTKSAGSNNRAPFTTRHPTPSPATPPTAHYSASQSSVLPPRARARSGSPNSQFETTSRPRSLRAPKAFFVSPCPTSHARLRRTDDRTQVIERNLCLLAERQSRRRGVDIGRRRKRRDLFRHHFASRSDVARERTPALGSS